MKPDNQKRLTYFRFLFFVVLIALPFVGRAQTQLLQEVLHHSPTISTLGKFGEVPVGHYTGVPNIEVPLYEATSGPLKVPVSLSYHAGGVKVEEVASSVGLSWSLQAGGAISRSVRGLPDDGSWYNVPASATVAAQMTVPSAEYLLGVEFGSIDAEPDIYHFNFNGRSGKFIIGQDGEIHIISKANLLISQYSGGWKIVDETGTQFLFEKVEINVTVSSMTASAWVLTKIISRDGKHSITLTYLQEGIIGYVANVGETKYIPLNGVDGCIPGAQVGMVQDNVNIMAQRLTRIDFESGYIEFNYFNQRCDVLADKVLDEVVVYSKDNTLIKKFVLAHSYFGTHTTCDNSQAPLKRLKLNSVTEMTASGSKPPYVFTYDESSPFPSRFSFSQDHWGYFNGANNNTLIPGNVYGALSNYNGADRRTNPAKAQLGVLKSIRYPTGGTTNFTYESNTIGYNPIENQNYEERTLQYTFSQLNYPVVNMQIPLGVTPLVIPASGALVTDFVVTGLNESPWPNCDISGVYLTKNGAPHGGKLLSTNGSTPFYWSMSEGTYGLTIIHDCAPQAVMPEFSILIRVKIPLVNNISYVGGLRVSKIEDVPGDGAVPVVREFRYNLESESNSSSGVLNNIPIYTQELAVTFADYTMGGMVTNCAYLVATARSSVPSATAAGSHIGYTFVTEILPDGSENRYSYLNFQGAYLPELPYAPNNLHEWRRGFLLNVKSYSKEGNTLLLAKEVSNTFTELSESHVYGLKLGRTQKKTYAGTPPPGVIDNPLPADTYSFYATHAMFFGTLSTTEKVYPRPGNLNEVIEKTTEYVYNPNHFQVIEKKERHADGTGGSKEEITFTKYSQDYGFTSTPVGTEAQGIKKLQDLHCVSFPIEQYTLKQNRNSQNQISNQRIVSGTLNVFKADNPYPDKIYALKLSQPVLLSAFVPSSITANNFQKSTLYTPVVSFIDYDSKGNLLSQRKTDDVTISYLWGYDKTLPVAEVKNAENASATGQFSFTDYSNVLIDQYIGDTPILSSFEIHSSQQISVTVGLQGNGNEIPQSPLVNFQLRRTNGTLVHGMSGVWGQNTYNFYLTPGTYEWYYSTGDVSFHSGFSSISLMLSITYSANRTGSRIFYTSFEDDGNYTAVAYTGFKARQGAYTVYLPAQNGSYKLTYMKWNGGAPENWECVSQNITVTSGVVQSLTIGSGSSIIDEVRLYPTGAAMTTYSYKPEFGLTSMTDMNSVVTYYDYDSFGRLKYLKDNKRQILKSFEYHYKGNN